MEERRRKTNEEIRREEETKRTQEEIKREAEKITKAERRQRRKKEKDEEQMREKMEMRNEEKTREYMMKDEIKRKNIQGIWREEEEEEEEKKEMNRRQETRKRREEEEATRKEREEEEERNKRLDEIRMRREEELQMTLTIQNKHQERIMNKKVTNNENKKKRRGGRRKPSLLPPLSEKERRQREEERTQRFKYNYYPCNSKVYLLAGKGAAAEGVAEWMVKGAGVVQLDKQTNTPFGKKYKFDRVFVKASNKTIYSVAVRGAVKHFCSTQNSVAIIFYGPSHTGKSRYLMGPAQHPKGILQRAFTDILTYAKAVRSYFCLFRVSYIEIYNERIEDLLTTTTTTTTPSLELVTDCGGRVVWCGAREVVITKLQELEDLYAQGHSEHVRRARRTKGRLEASHTVFRIIMESLPRYRDYSRWEEVSVAISFLDFVTVAGVELLPALGSVTEELRGGPAVTQSLFTLHNFVVSECSNKSMLYDGRRTVLTRVLREALVGDSHSIFLCTCSLANTTHTLDTVRFGDAAAWLVQHPTRRLYLASLLHTTTAAILHSHQAARRLLCSKRTHGTAGSGLRKEQQEEQEEQDSRVRQEVRKMLGLARTIFPINTSINTKRNELESEEEPVVARKRGRPRKYPVRFKPFGRECPTKIDYLALWKSRYLNSEDPRQERGRKQKREREEKFYMAGAFTLTTTSKRHGLRHLYKTGSLRTSDTSTYYGGYLKEGLKKKEEEERGVREEDEKENEEMEEEKEEEEEGECKFGKECVWVREEDEKDEKKNEGIGEEKVKEGECKSVWVREQEDEKENERIREEKEEEEECETDKRKERVRREKDEKKCRVEKKNERIGEEKEEEEKCRVNKRDGEKREEKKEEEGERDKNEHDKMNKGQETMTEEKEEENKSNNCKIDKDVRMKEEEEEEEEEWEDMEEWIAIMEENNWREEEEDRNEVNKEEIETENKEEEESKGRNKKQKKKEEEKKRYKNEENKEAGKDKKKEKRNKEEEEREDCASKKEEEKQNQYMKNKHEEETDKQSDEDMKKMEKKSRHKENKKEQEKNKNKHKKEEISVKQKQENTDEIENHQNNKENCKKQEKHKENNDKNSHKEKKEKQHKNHDKNEKQREIPVEFSQEIENEQNNKENSKKQERHNENKGKQHKNNDKKEIPIKLSQEIKNDQNNKADSKKQDRLGRNNDGNTRRKENKEKQHKNNDKNKKQHEIPVELNQEDLEMIPLQKCKKEKEEKERTQGLVNCVRGTITITRAWDVCVDGEATQHLAKEYEMGSYKPKKVNFCLSNMEYRDLKWKLDDGYVHFLRLGLWIQYFREELAVRDQAGRLVYSLPDFIALKEVFVDLFLTPYRRSSHLWRVKAVSFEDGRVYLQSSRTIARSPEKLSPKAAFTAHLMGLHTPGHDTSGKKRVVPFPGQHWQVYWGEVEGLGLLYSSLVDLTDRSARVTRRAMARHPQLAGVLREVVSERHFMYRTHLYQAPQDTQAWRDAMWFTFLEWWADYQFGRLPTIIGGEMTGQQVTAIRLFCAQTLPQLAQAWCDRPAWDTGLGEQYLSSLLRFIKYWCNKRPRETLSFELQENGDVLCCKRRFKIASQHFLVNSILPDEFVRDVYPAPPPQPKPSWPGKRGRKSKPRVTPQPTRPRRVTCHWKLPRYCDVETEPPTSPPRYVFRPEMKDPQNPHNVKQSDTCGFFTDAGWGLGERGKTQRPARHTRFKDKEPNKESDTFGLFTDAGWGLGEQRETHRTARHTRSSRGARHCSQARQHSQHSQSRHSLQNCDPRRLTEGLTRAQVSREVDKRAREWYKSTVPSLSLPKSFIAENRDEGRQRLSDSESEDTITSRRNEMLFAPLPVQELKAAAGRQREERHSREREAVSEEEV